MECTVCQDVGFCEACGGRASREALMGTAGARGAFWAEAVILELGDRRPPRWPPFEGKARDIALRKVADLGGSAEVREERAKHCWDRAQETYEDGGVGQGQARIALPWPLPPA